MTTLTAHQQRLARSTDCELRFDDLTRQLYATDASIYQIEPLGVAFPRSADQTAGLMRAASDTGVSVIPRGAGTGLAGGAVGDGIIVDLARYNRRISDLDRDRRTVRVEPGVVLDQLNAFLKPHGLWFGPDVATSSRATLGGMIANNSSGARSVVYGTTADHVVSLEIILADGTVATVGADHNALPDRRTTIDQIIRRRAAAVAERMPVGLLKRWPGYGFDRYLRDNGNLTRLIAGSEGTLAIIFSAVLDLAPIPARRGLGVIFFASVPDAMQATVELLDLKPAAIENVDRLCFDGTRGQLAFKKARELLRLDDAPCEAMLLVEFFDDIDDRLAALSRRSLGLRKLICTDPQQQELIWSLRRSGLTLLTGCKGAAKPTPGIEDVCVRPERLPEYVAGLRSLIEPLGVQVSYYGHAASGLLHVRPKLDLHTAEDIAKYRQIADGVSDLCRRFNGSLTGEHGVGIARTEYLPDHLGPELMSACREIKQLFDPRNLLNPGKIIPAVGAAYGRDISSAGTASGRDAPGVADPFRIDTNLRLGAGHAIPVPFSPVLGFIEKDGSFIANLEQCNGCGGCRKDPPTMCPTYIATGEEIMSTRGRANTIRAVLERRLGANGDPLSAQELDAALSNCLSCKACKRECPSNVDLTHLKAELVHARHQRNGIPLLDRLIANADLLGRVGSAFAPLSNFVLRLGLARWFMEKTLGFTSDRPLPPYARTRFDRWFARRHNHRAAGRPRVILWDDTWVRYHEPNIGIAAVKVLEAAGFDVALAEGRKCCGRPAASRGVLDEVRRLGQHNIDLFTRLDGDELILFLEASCYSMFVDEYRQLGIPNADAVARRCVLFEQFIFDLLDRRPDALPFRSDTLRVAIHAHCHAKALTDAKIMPALVERIPGASVKLLDTGCCGMAGAFGMLKKKYDLSRQVAQDLVDKINALPPGTCLIASGTSCRHQITHLTTARPLHMAELFAEAL